MICFLSLPALDAVQCLMDMPTAVESFTLTCRAHSFFPEGIKLFRYQDDELLSEGSFTDAEVKNKGSLAHGDKNVMQRKPNSIYTTTECSSLLTSLHKECYKEILFSHFTRWLFYPVFFGQHVYALLFVPLENIWRGHTAFKPVLALP